LAKIIVIDDELGMEALVSRLHFAGHDVERFVSSTEALKNISDVLSSDLIFLDIILPSTFSSSQNSSTECLTAGMEVFREIRKINKSLPIIAYSATQDASVIETLESDSNVHYVSKFGSPSLKKLIGIVNYALGLQNEKLSLNSFIVHGHDDEAKLQLKNYLQNTLICQNQ
jgi:CheY-like chemotaxis protein